jgi:hypothetical protein
VVLKPEATEPKQATSKRSNSGSRTAVKYAAILLMTVGLFRIGMSDEPPAAFRLSPVPARAAVLPEQREATAAEVSPRSDVPFRRDPRVLGNSADDGGHLYYLYYLRHESE